MTVSRRRFLQQGSAGALAAAAMAPDANAARADNDPRLKVALLQMMPDDNNQAYNLEKGLRFCKDAAGMGADIALMPEIWNIGYTRFKGEDPETIREWQAQATPRDGAYVNAFRELAKSTGMAIGVTYLEKWDPAPRNSISVIDRFGEIVMTYAKVHTCDFKTMECCCTPGDDFYTADLNTAKGNVRVGAMICFDREQPESARILMLKGAELILTPNACGLDSRRIDQFKTRAFENTAMVAMTNYPAPRHNGRSVAFDAEGKAVVEAGGEEGIYMAAFDLERARWHRGRSIWGNAYRRPHRYGALVDTHVAPEFERKNGFGKPFEPIKR